MTARLLIGALLWAVLLVSGAQAALEVGRVEVDCGKGPLCQRQRPRYQVLRAQYRNATHLQQTLKVMASRGGVRDFAWELSEADGTKVLRLQYTPKVPIGKVEVRADVDAVKETLERGTRLRPDGWLDPSVFPEEERRLEQALALKGYVRASVRLRGVDEGDEARIIITASAGRPQIVRSFKVTSSSPVVRKFTELKFRETVGRPFDAQLVRARADELEAELFGYGYYLAAIALVPSAEGRDVTLEVRAENLTLHIFDVRRGREDAKVEMAPLIQDLFRRFRRPLDEESLKAGIQEHLRKRGFLKPRVDVKIERRLDANGEDVRAYRIDYDPGVRTRVRRVSFVGGGHWGERKLRSMWREQAQELAAAGFYDEESNAAFSDWLRAEYIKEGFVRAAVSSPQVEFSGHEAEVSYTLNEGQRVLVDGITFTGVDEAEESALSEAITTKEGVPFNPTQFAEDVRLVAEMLQNRGWYDAEVVNRDGGDIVVYGKDRVSVRVHFKIRKGRYLTFNRLVLVGNRRTDDRVIKRKSPFKEGEPVTPAMAKEYEARLSTTGLFSSVRVRPIAHKGSTSATDVAVEVVERDYGLIELAPGYRTDIGLKLSGTISYMNILGHNRSISLTGQVNQRLDFATLDARRREEGKQMLEWNLGTQYSQPDIFETWTDYGASANFQRRRFFAFDADILRLANTLSRDFGPRFSASLRHQFERINQFDATEERDNGSFTIGAFTPSATLDFRNTRANPTAGAWFNASCEFANPFFLSQKNDDLEINFYKLISRNRFYLPIPRGTIAISVVGGIQENLARDYKRDADGNPVVDEDGVRERVGYIPSIKLFRLTGTDIVRGYSDEEINRLPNGQDIGDQRIQNRAYMANIKVEPRYFVTDHFMAGVFYDAGRVFVEQVDLGDLRESAGITFKVVTPVGTLDFDYGIKLLRKRDSDGRLESPGRFHVSIGFF